jgi:hypothetical protein
MRYLLLLALPCASALVAAALVCVPSHLEPLIETQPDWKAQRAQLRRAARAITDRYEKMYGELPIDEWPEERRREIYRGARRILDEVGEDVRDEP